MRTILFTLGCSVFFLPSPAPAQLLNDNDVVNVKNRMDPDWDPLGVTVGTFVLSPKLGVRETWDDNIYRRPEEESDFITELQPEITLHSNWNLHAVELNVRGDSGIYAGNPDENYNDYAVSAYGRYDLAYETHVNAKLTHEHLHEDRGSPNDVNGDEPTTYNRETADVGFYRGLGRIKLTLGGQYQDYSFDNTESGGITIDNSTRDRTQYRASTRLGYEFMPNYEIFAGAGYNLRDYDQSAAFDRSSDGYDIKIGTALNITGKVKGELYGGYLEQNYEQPLFEDFDAANYGGSLLWNIIGITSFYADAERTVTETNSGGSSGILHTDARAGITHALRRNIMLDGFAGYEQDDFVGGTKRKDDILKAGLGLTYKPLRGADVKLQYGYRDRQSDLDTAEYSNNRLTLGISYEF